MRAAFARGDVVDIGKKALGIAVGVLNGDAADDGILLSFEVNRLIVQDSFAVVQIPHIVDDAALAVEGRFAAGRVAHTLVEKDDFQAPIQVCQLLQAAEHRVVIEAHVLENRVIGKKTHECALLACVADFCQGRVRLARDDLAFLLIELTCEAHGIMAEIAVDVHGQPLAQCVDDRRAHAVQTAGIAVILVVELAARVQHGENDLRAADVHGRVLIHGHTAPVVVHRRGAVRVQRHAHLIRKAVRRLVNRVIHNLPEQVMQTARRGGADIHARTHPNRFQPFQHLNIARIIVIRLICHEKTPLIMKEVYQNRNGDKAPIFIISQFRRFIKANSKMTLGQFGRGKSAQKGAVRSTKT